MKQGKIALGVLLLVLLFTVAIGCGPSDAEETIKIKAAHVTSAADDSSWQVVLVKFAERLEELTDGRIKVDVHGGGVLGGELDYIDQMLAGTLEVAIVTNSPMGNHDANFHFYDLPYLFVNLEEVREVLVNQAPIEQWFTNRMEEMGLINLGFVEQGFRCFFNTKHPVHSLSDMKGLKLRTMESEFVIKTFQALGASPVPMSYAELYSNIQAGIVDGGDTTNTGYFIAGFQEIAPYLTLASYAYNPTRLVTSKEFYDSLDSDLQQALREAAEYATQVSIDEYEKYWQKVLDEKNEKVDVHIPEHLDEFIEAGRGLWDELLESIPEGEMLMKLFEESTSGE